MTRARWIPIGLAAIALGVWLTQPAPEAPSDAAPHEKNRVPLHAAGLSGPMAAPIESPAPGPDLTEEKEAGAYLPGQRLVRLADPMELPDLVAAHGVTIERPVGRSGLAVVAGDPASLERLTADTRVVESGNLGVMYGAGCGEEGNGELQLQWHLDMINPGEISSAGSYTVAVLDSGIAYETATRGGISYTQAPSLASSPIRAPYDFVNDDPYPNDDEGHGTHIASTLAGNGVIRGVTPGVGLMPVKVLDEHNRGTEYGLIEGIYHAIDNGADVINLSLSFRPGYVASRSLQEALHSAYEAGVVVVAAAGNHGVDTVSWPAASPSVIAVGGSQLYPDTYYDFYAGYMTRIMDYSNRSGKIDAVAPGGNLAVDRNYDGIPDGILAEAVNPDNPAEVGYWLMAGTSQAAAQVSGLAVQYLFTGMDPHDVGPTLQRDGRYGDFNAGKGGGYASMWGYPPPQRYWGEAVELHASLLPFLRDGGNVVHPAAQVALFHEDGSRVGAGWTAIVNVVGENGGTLSCTTNGSGICTVYGGSVWKSSASAWSMSLVGAQRHGVIQRPHAAVTSTPALDGLVAAIEARVDLRDTMLAWSWTTTDDQYLGVVSEGLSLVDVGGSGLSSIPLGVVLTKPAMDLLGLLRSRTVDVNGHEVQLSLLELDGNGLSSIPLGLRDFRILAVDGSGLSSIPLGLRARDLLGGGHTVVRMAGHGLASLPLGFKNTPLGKKLGGGGWNAGGYGAASAIASSTDLPIEATFSMQYEGSAIGLEPYAP